MIKFFTRNEKSELVCADTNTKAFNDATEYAESVADVIPNFTGDNSKQLRSKFIDIMVKKMTTSDYSTIVLSKPVEDTAFEYIENSRFNELNLFTKINPNALYLDVYADDDDNIITEANLVHFINVSIDEHIDQIRACFSSFNINAFISVMHNNMVDDEVTDAELKYIDRPEFINEIELYTAISNIGDIPMFLTHHKDIEGNDIWYIYGLMVIDDGTGTIGDIVRYDDYSHSPILGMIEPPYQNKIGYTTTWNEIQTMFHDIKRKHIC